MNEKSRNHVDIETYRHYLLVKKPIENIEDRVVSIFEIEIYRMVCYNSIRNRIIVEVIYYA